MGRSRRSRTRVCRDKDRPTRLVLFVVEHLAIDGVDGDAHHAVRKPGVVSDGPEGMMWRFSTPQAQEQARWTAALLAKGERPGSIGDLECAVAVDERRQSRISQ